MNSAMDSLPEHFESGGSLIEFRPLAASDHAALLAFARSLDVQELLFLPRDIREPSVLDAWLKEESAGNLNTIVVSADDVLIGCGTVARDLLSWSAHVAEIRCVLDPAWRGRGIGMLLIREAFKLAVLGQAEKIVAHMTANQKGAITGFQGLGFASEAVLKNHVGDRAGHRYDLLVLSRHVESGAVEMATFGLV